MIEKFKLNSFFTNLNKILESPFKKSSKTSLASILSYLKPVQISIKLLKEPIECGDIKCQKIIGQSILENITFPYVYDPESEGVPYKQLYADMKTYLISDTDIFTILKQYCPFFNSEKTEIIYNISQIDTYNKFSIESIENLLEQTHLEKDDESTIDSDSESDDSNDVEEADF